MALPPEVLEEFLALQRDEADFKARKAHFLASMAETPDKLGDRVLERLLEDEEALRQRKAALSTEVKERFGFDL